MDIKIYNPKTAFFNNYVNKSIEKKDCGRINNVAYPCAVIDSYGKFYPKPLLINPIKNVKLSFTGYYGDPQPLRKLFWLTAQRNSIYEDDWTKKHIYSTGYHKWVNAKPNELLKRTPEETIQSLCTITKQRQHYPQIPDYIPTPNYGDKWGRHANYIEINPRLVAKYDGNQISEGLFGLMKIITAIPPTAGKGANCIILSQLYPSLWGDGTTEDDSLYCANLHTGISKNLTSGVNFSRITRDTGHPKCLLTSKYKSPGKLLTIRK